MKAGREVGILGYGAYVPRTRIRNATIASAWGRAANGRYPVREKSVPGLDEDTVTMAIEAARGAVARAGVDSGSIRAVWIGSESKPYAVKPSGTIVAEAIGATPWVSAADLEFACKAGSEAVLAACALVGSGMADLAMGIGMDAAQSKPGDHLEYTASAGGAAFLIGPAKQAVARIEAMTSYVSDTPDFFRRQHMHYPEHGHRFTGEPGYFGHSRGAARGLLESLGRRASDYRFAVFHQPNPKFMRRIAAEIGFSEEQIAPGAVVDHIGNTYSGASLIGLAGILDVADEGDRIFFCSYGSGAGSDALSLVATARLRDSRGAAPAVRDYLERRHEIDDYGRYLRQAGKIRLQ